MSKPSAYNRSNLEKGEVVEDRDEVKVTFAGGNVWYVQAEGTGEGEHETQRGADAAWKRAEELRKELNPDYAGPPPEADETSGASTSDDEQPAKAKKGKKPKKGKKAKAAKSSKGKGGESDGEREIMFGDVKGVRRMVPVAVVEDLLSDHQGRVALLQGSDEARRLARRVRATDGRCAPIFLTKKDLGDKKEEPKLFDGLYTLATAINLDMSDVAVVVLPADQVGRVQGMVANMMTASLDAAGDVGDDELMRRSNSR